MPPRTRRKLAEILCVLGAFSVASVFRRALEFAAFAPLAAPTCPLRYARWVKHHCPICKKPTDSESDAEFPFCSQRCRLLDLGNWASEKYVVSEPAMDESDSEIPEREADERNN